MEQWNTSRTLLMRISAKESDEALAQFSETYTPYIYSLFKKYDLSHQDSEELTQDVLLKVWNTLNRFIYEPNRCRFRTWLARVCRNSALKHIDLKRSRSQKIQLDDSADELLKLLTPSDQEAKEEIEWQIFIAERAWENIQGAFTESQRQAYIGMMAGEAATEVAAKIGLKENSVYVYRKKVQLTMSHEIQRLSSELDG